MIRDRAQEWVTIRTRQFPLLGVLYGSFEGTGSAFIDTLATAPAFAYNIVLMFIGGLGGDLGSTGSAGI
ncbi:MAG: hypothetical protein ACK4UY_03640 [Dietzia sp.]